MLISPDGNELFLCLGFSGLSHIKKRNVQRD